MIKRRFLTMVTAIVVVSLSTGNATAQSTNNRNLTMLERDYQREEDEFTNSEMDLGRQREQGINDYRSQVEGQRADLLNTRGTLAGQRVIAEGGDFNAARMAASPYTSRISAILDSIDIG